MDTKNKLYSFDGTQLLELFNFCLKKPYRKTKGHSHHHLEISCIKSGDGIYFVDDYIYEIVPGDVFVFNNIEQHDIDLGESSELINMVIHFEPQFI